MVDLLEHDLNVVFCGTAKGRISARTGSFYANPSNRFYKVLHEIGLTNRQISPESFRSLLNDGIGLTDLNQSESGMDRDLTSDGFDIIGFRQKMLHFRPRVIAFSSLNAGRIYFNNRRVGCGLQAEMLDGARIIVLPSTSGANGHWTRDRHHWYQLPQLLESV